MLAKCVRGWQSVRGHTVSGRGSRRAEIEKTVRSIVSGPECAYIAVRLLSTNSEGIFP